MHKHRRKAKGFGEPRGERQGLMQEGKYNRWFDYSEGSHGVVLGVASEVARPRSTSYFL